MAAGEGLGFVDDVGGTERLTARRELAGVSVDIFERGGAVEPTDEASDDNLLRRRKGEVF